jgi:hypothetical protein
MSCNNNGLFRNLVAGEALNRGINHVLAIADACILEVDGRFFLLVLVNYANADTVFVIRLTRPQAVALAAHVRVCQPRTGIPTGVLGTSTLGTNVLGAGTELECVFTVDRQAFLVFTTEGVQERIIVVRVPLCPVSFRDID